MEELRKGMSIISLNANPCAWKVFEVELWSCESFERRIKFRFEPVVTIKHIRQVCRFKNFSKDNNINEESNSFWIFDDNNSCNYIKNQKRQKKIDHNKTKFSTFETNEFKISPDESVKLFLEFKNNPEFIEVGNHILINDISLKAFGYITKLVK